MTTIPEFLAGLAGQALGLEAQVFMFPYTLGLPASGGGGGSSPETDIISEQRALLIGKLLAVGAAATVAAPLVSASLQGRKRGKNARTAQKDAQIASGVDIASNRIAALGSAFTKTAILTAPLAYILVETMENYPIKVHDADGNPVKTHLISGEFGDRLQTIIASAVGADLASQIGKLIPGT